MSTRLNKLLSERGIASRRRADELIAAGLIQVNGKIIRVLGTKVDPAVDRIEVDRQVLADRAKLVCLALHKPAGCTTSSQKTKLDPQIVLDLVPKSPRVFPIGRLDKNTTGLLLFTNDGVLAYRLTHPKFACEKEYEVELATPLTAGRVRKIEAGVRLERQPTAKTRIRSWRGRHANIILTEGRNRQIRKIFGKVGCEVTHLKRVRIKNLELAKLPLGKWRQLSAAEVILLRS